jgi:2-polyprenyl-3-methyl-5-hydroxy-6-metoxy-1,4-benzoquinol methylase
MERIEYCEVCGNREFKDFLVGSDYFLTKEEFTIVKCDKCGFLFVNPRPSAQNIKKYYESTNYISHTNNSKGILNKAYHIIRRLNHKKKYNLILRHKEVGTILDIGCATGEFLKYLQDRNWDTIGIEPDDKARQYAIEKYGLNIYSEIYLKEISKEKIDVVTMWHVLEHVHFLKDRIKQINRILTNNGTLIIAVPNPECYDAKKYGKFWAGYDLPRHIHHFSQQTIVKLLKEFGFKLEERIPMKFDAYYICMLSEKYKTGKMNLMKAVLGGIKSNRWAKKNNDNFSSMIYVFQKIESIKGPY